MNRVEPGSDGVMLVNSWIMLLKMKERFPLDSWGETNDDMIKVDGYEYLNKMWYLKSGVTFHHPAYVKPFKVVILTK